MQRRRMNAFTRPMTPFLSAYLFSWKSNDTSVSSMKSNYICGDRNLVINSLISYCTVRLYCIFSSEFWHERNVVWNNGIIAFGFEHAVLNKTPCDVLWWILSVMILHGAIRCISDKMKPWCAYFRTSCKKTNKQKNVYKYTSFWLWPINATYVFEEYV